MRAHVGCRARDLEHWQQKHGLKWTRQRFLHSLHGGAHIKQVFALKMTHHEHFTFLILLVCRFLCGDASNAPCEIQKTLSSCCRHSRQQMDVMICYVKEKWALKFFFLVLFSLSPGMCHRCAYQFFKKSCATVNSVEFRQVKTIFNFKWWKVFCAAFLPCVCRLVNIQFLSEAVKRHERTKFFHTVFTVTWTKFDAVFRDENKHWV